MAKKSAGHKSAAKQKKSKPQPGMRKFIASHRKLLTLLAFAFVFAIVGSVALYIAFASTTKSANFEAESFRLNSHVERISDDKASGRQAMRYRSNTSLPKAITLPQNTVQINVRAKGQQCNGAPKAIIKIDGVTIATPSVKSKLWANYTINRTIGSGPHVLTVGFTNNYNKYSGKTRVCTRDLDVDKVTFYRNVPDEPEEPDPDPEPTGAVPCALTAAAASCWVANTGVKKGTGYTPSQIIAGNSNLTHVTSQANAPAGTTYSNGNLNVNVAGTVINRIWLDGCVAVKAKNVVIKNSLFRSANACYGGNGQSGGAVINTGNGSEATGLSVTDVDVDGRNSSIDLIGISLIGGDCTRCQVRGATKGFWTMPNTTIRESAVTSLSSNNGNIHSEALDADSSDHVTIDHSYFRSVGTSGAVTAAISLLATWGPASHITVNNSYMEGNNGADLHCATSDFNLTITNNMFSSNNGYSSTTYAMFCGGLPGTTWSNNKVPETGKTVNPNGSVN